MAINLEKNQGINLSKGLNNVRASISWDTSEDVDIFAMLLENGRGKRDEDFVYFHNLEHDSGAVKHSGDVRNGTHQTGADDEYLDINLSKIPANITEVVILADIYNGASLGLHFGKIPNSIGKVVDVDANKTLATFKLDKDLIGQTTCLLARFVRSNEGWRFENMNQPAMSLAGALISKGF